MARDDVRWAVGRYIDLPPDPIRTDQRNARSLVIDPAVIVQLDVNRPGRDGLVHGRRRIDNDRMRAGPRRGNYRDKQLSGDRHGSKEHR